MIEILKDELDHLKENFTVFDQRFNRLMKEHPYYASLIKKERTYDMYRDLDMVWADKVC